MSYGEDSNKHMTVLVAALGRIATGKHEDGSELELRACMTIASLALSHVPENELTAQAREYLIKCGLVKVVTT